MQLDKILRILRIMCISALVSTQLQLRAELPTEPQKDNSWSAYFYEQGQAAVGLYQQYQTPISIFLTVSSVALAVSGFSPGIAFDVVMQGSSLASNAQGAWDQCSRGYEDGDHYAYAACALHLTGAAISAYALHSRFLTWTKAKPPVAPRNAPRHGGDQVPLREVRVRKAPALGSASKMVPRTHPRAPRNLAKNIHTLDSMAKQSGASSSGSAVENVARGSSSRTMVLTRSQTAARNAPPVVAPVPADPVDLLVFGAAMDLDDGMDAPIAQDDAMEVSSQDEDEADFADAEMEADEEADATDEEAIVARHSQSTYKTPPRVQAKENSSPNRRLSTGTKRKIKERVLTLTPTPKGKKSKVHREEAVRKANTPITKAATRMARKFRSDERGNRNLTELTDAEMNVWLRQYETIVRNALRGMGAEVMALEAFRIRSNNYGEVRRLFSTTASGDELSGDDEAEHSRPDGIDDDVIVEVKATVRENAVIGFTSQISIQEQNSVELNVRHVVIIVSRKNANAEGLPRPSRNFRDANTEVRLITEGDGLVHRWVPNDRDEPIVDGWWGRWEQVQEE